MARYNVLHGVFCPYHFFTSKLSHHDGQIKELIIKNLDRLHTFNKNSIIVIQGEQLPFAAKTEGLNSKLQTEMCENEFEKLAQQLRSLNVEDYFRLLETVQKPKEQVAIKQPEETEEYISAKEAADFLKKSLQTIYQNIDRYPFRKIDGKLYFLKSKLQAYIEAGKQTPKEVVKTQTKTQKRVHVTFKN